MKWKNKLQRHQWLFFLALVVVLIGTMMISLMNGAVSVSLATVQESFQSFDESNQLHQVIQTIRLPRILGAAMVGASLAVSGALAQGITQNPLADSGLLGINAGAGLGLAVVFAFFPSSGYWWILLASFIGAGISVAIIYYISKCCFRNMKIKLHKLLLKIVQSFFETCTVPLNQWQNVLIYCKI